MSEPSVCAILLSADRPEMTRKAIESYRAQNYGNKHLLILDSTEEANRPKRGTPDSECYDSAGHTVVYVDPSEFRTIGDLRNKACEMAAWNVRLHQIIVTFDSDDYSHPNRIAEQVALLQSSGADVVGYNEMLFWRESVICGAGPACPHDKPGEAWLYSNPNPQYALGTSLAYKREVWERKPFEATSHGEDEKFIRGLKVVSISAQMQESFVEVKKPMGCWESSTKPRMIARIHSSNTSTAYSPRKMEAEARKKDGMWKRVPSWDAYCAETMR